MAASSPVPGTRAVSAARFTDALGHKPGLRLCLKTPKLLPWPNVPTTLRHAAVSTWLNAGVEPTRVAEWAGHSVHVLLRVYAKCLDGGERVARDRVQQALEGCTEPWAPMGVSTRI